MALRVTSVNMQVLHVGKIGVTSYHDSAYDHNYSAYDMEAVSAFDVEIGTTLEGTVGTSSYFLAGFEQFENAAFSAAHDLNAYKDYRGRIGNGTYAINVYTKGEMSRTHAYRLEAFVQYEDFRQGFYDLNAFEPKSTVVNSKYGIEVFLLAQGYLQGLYDIDVYVDLITQVIAAYDYNTYEQYDAPVATFTHDLNAWEAREAIVGAHWALLTLAQSTGYLDTQNALNVFQRVEARLGINYSLEAYQLLQQQNVGTYNIEVLTLAQLGFTSKYSVEIFKAFSGFADATHVLNAFQAATQSSDHAYNVDIYVGLTGEFDATYILEAFLAVTGSIDGTYLLDTTQELFTWVVNQETGAPSRYENYDFDAFAQIGEDYLAARGDGIYLLSGDDDSGAAIDAIATIGRTDFDEASMKRVTAAYLGLNSAGQVHLTIRTDQGISTGPYELRQSPTASTTERAKFKRGLKSRYWEFDIQNVDGADLQVKSAEFETTVLRDRRLKK
jgi:hypothetical protein